MCGISGIINIDFQEVKKSEIKKITDLIRHRGPNDKGYFLKNNFAFGFRRLSILDLSIDGHQPMHYLDRYTIIFNGEIYNYIELKNELLKNNYEFKSGTDTEVILASYDFWGKKCVEKFNGMWAFAIHDKVKNEIFLSRDRFGIKPLYYSKIGNKFVFGSEIKQIIEFQEKVLVNKKVLIDFIVTSFEEHTEETFFQDVKKLKQSHNLTYDLKTNNYSISKYYSISHHREIEKLSERESIDKFHSELKRSIDYRLRSDVTVGSCLSGGLDSSTVASIASSRYMKESSNKKFTAIHAKSTEKDSDESYYASKVSEISNLDLIIVKPSIEDFKSHIDEVAYTQEEPFGGPSIFMQYFVMKKAKEIGCTVMLDGQGGDEILLGYEKYYPSAYLNIFQRKGFLAMLKTIRESNKNNSRMTIYWIAKFFIGSLFSSLRKIVYKRKANFMKPHSNDFNFLDKLASSYLNIFSLQEKEIMSTNLPCLLKFEDKNSMRNSIEARLPFLDYKVLETALSIDIDYKIKEGWTKYVLRKIISKKMPSEIAWRKNKLGFNAPESTWIDSLSFDIKTVIKNSQILNEICHVDKILKNIKSYDNRLKWRLYSIAVWEKVYNVKIS
ncbi:MAG: asparagine synthase (glutamine-hydrolyzing) [Flavobacteriaceae bacterium]|jgi:asparagine synthase (glutamine-hydrolysing)|nr:asparagine synthase (glutamine-hydrolyzing) [Pelagibacteraceae bacterium]MBT6170108.1 asparagine synthase (glutamine-hydrolyzing) [Flavobacteriaceae bacterium]MBT6447147.1 asparagine synthase (glutamine-hydrolyzing) [Flavobacteriaceae bacterium]